MYDLALLISSKSYRGILCLLSFLLIADCTATATDASCCNNKPGGCGENEGDCDNDSHCKAGLKCGTDNCPSSFPSSYDCCYKGILYYASQFRFL